MSLLKSSKTAFLKGFVFLLRPFIKKHPKANRFLIVSTTALGDSLWTTAVIASLKQALPDCYLGVLTSSIGKEVFENNPHLNKIFVFNKSSFFSLRKGLYREKFDTVIFCHASQRLVLPLCSLIGAKEIIGTSGLNKGLDSLFTKAIKNKYEHEIQRRLNLINAIGIESSVKTVSFFLKKEEIIPKKSSSFQIALHPGSKDPFKRWPLKSFASLGARLKKELNCELFIVGVEEDLTQKLHEETPSLRVKNKSLREFASFLNTMDLLVTNDTGPFHLALALQIPVIGIFASTDPNLCGPFHAQNAFVIQREQTCFPCLKRKCPLPFCFWQIGIDEVFQKIKKIYEQKNSLKNFSDQSEEALVRSN